MSTLNKILAAALVAQLVLAVVVLTRDPATTVAELVPVVSFDKATVTRVQIDAAAEPGADGKPTPPRKIDLVKQEGGWVLASHHAYPADAAKVEELLTKLDALRTRGASATGAARAKQLQVADDDFGRKLTLTRDGGADIVLLIGDVAGPGRTALRRAGSDEILSVAGMPSSGVSIEPADYVATSFSEVDEAKVARLTVKNARGTFALERAADGWKIAIDGKPTAPPKGEVVDTFNVDDLVRAAAKIEFAAPADPARQVASPEATVTVAIAEPPAAGQPAPAESTAAEERVFELASDKDDQYFVRQKGNPRPVLVRGSRLRALLELDRTKLFRKPDPPPPPSAPGAQPGLEGLPPELLQQLQQQAGGVP